MANKIVHLLNSNIMILTLFLSAVFILQMFCAGFVWAMVSQDYTMPFGAKVTMYIFSIPVTLFLMGAFLFSILTGD